MMSGRAGPVESAQQVALGRGERVRIHADPVSKLLLQHSDDVVPGANLGFGFPSLPSLSLPG